MNGRYGADKGIGKTTCKNASVVDYILISAPYVDKFDILEFDCIISDIHCPVNAVFILVGLLEKEDDLSNKTLHTRSEHVIKYMWKSDSAASFQSNVSDSVSFTLFQKMHENAIFSPKMGGAYAGYALCWIRHCQMNVLN